MPIVTFIDTPGAFPGISSEERHIAEAIAVNLREMFRLRVPILATVIGEGGSGGALGIGVADRLLMFEHSVYTVASPEACASILWRDAGKAPEAAVALRITGPLERREPTLRRARRVAERLSRSNAPMIAGCQQVARRH